MLVLLFYILTVRFVLKRFEKLYGVFNFIFFFTVFHIAYTLMIPIELIFFKVSRFSVAFLNPEIYILWSFIAYLGFIIPFLIAGRKKIKLKYTRVPIKTSLKNLNIFFVFYFFIGILFFRNSILKGGTYYGNIELSSNPLYKFYINIGIVCSAVIISIYMRNKKYVKGGIIMLCLILWSLYSSDKNPILIGFLGVLFGFNIFFKKKRSFLYLNVIIIVIPVFSILFSSYRAGRIESVDIYRSLYSNSDPKGPFKSIIYAEKGLNNTELSYGESYIKSLATWVPSSIWKNRPEDLSIQFAKENISDYYKGLGLGFSPIAEGLINFGSLGPFLHYFFNASCLVLLFMFLKSLKMSQISNYISNLFLIVYLTMMHRSPFNLPADIIRILIPLLLIFYIRKFSTRNECTSYISNQ